MEKTKHLILPVIGYMLVNYLVYGETIGGWAGIIGAVIGGGLSVFLFEKD